MTNISKESIFLRYSLRRGKFGCYFYDSKVDIDLTLEMVLNRLNQMTKLISQERAKNSILTKEVIAIRRKIILLENPI